MPVADYCQCDVRTVGKDVPIADAARRMADERIGCLVVLDETDKPCGVVTDRDVALRTLCDGLDPKTTPVGALLGEGLIAVRESTLVRIAVALMREHGVRRLPVIDGKARLVGVVAWDDLVGLVAHELGNVAGTIAAQAPRGAPVARARALQELVEEA